MTFEEFWKENYEKEFGTSEPYYGIASYAFEKGQENCNCVYTDNSKVIQKLEKEKTDLVQEKNNLEYKIENLENKVEHHQEVIDTLQKKLERNCTSKGGLDGRT